MSARTRGTITPKPTPAVQRALAVLAASGIAKESNVTSAAGSLIYWQSRAWLTKHGFVKPAPRAGWYQLTADGWALVDRLKLAGSPGRLFEQ